ncbi:Neurochondrin-domain-containing protein [Xylaria arbuscula]|nr:Neurochondrin-domain-containing protein [Xylaria arbuscula]
MESSEIQKIHELLAANDDTSRFVGLLLLKTTLDNHTSDLQQEQVARLWDSISARFLDRLIRTGSRAASEQRKQSGDMLDVAVAVIYTFTKLLNDCALDEKFYARIPNLANAVLYSSPETTQRILDLIHVLVQQPYGRAAGGATCFAELDVDSWASLIESAPANETVFSIFQWAWVNGTLNAPVEAMRTKIDDALLLFVSSFKGHHPTPLLDFITLVLDNLNPNLRSSNPAWLRPVATLIQDMASNKQTQDGRRAYTHCAAALVTAYPEKAPKSLFLDELDTSRPIAYLFVQMVQVDIRSTLHRLSETNSTEYPSLQRRIAAALDIMTSFVGFLIYASDDITVQKGLTPDRILKLREALTKLIGDVMEYLRDRWDDFLAGARGIDSTQNSGKSIFEDPIPPAAVSLVATWLGDDDGEELRSQAAGLIDLFAELYKMNLTSTDSPELRLPILEALRGIVQTSASDGRKAFNNSDLLSNCLYPDLRTILTRAERAGSHSHKRAGAGEFDEKTRPYTELTAGDYLRGSGIVKIFHILTEYNENPPPPYRESMALVESIAKFDTEPATPGDVDLSRPEFQTDLLELAAELLDNTSRDSQLVLQQGIRVALKNSTSKLMKTWTALDETINVERLAQLRFD